MVDRQHVTRTGGELCGDGPVDGVTVENVAAEKYASPDICQNVRFSGFAAGKSRADDIPFAVVAAGDGFTNRLSHVDARWTDGIVAVSIDGEGYVSVRSPGRGLSSVTLSWKSEWASGALFLNDAWERSYGDIGWQTLPDSGILASKSEMFSSIVLDIAARRG